MTFVLAELAVLQAWLLPGWAITSRRGELTLTDRLLLAAPLSATINCLLIEILTLTHAYNRSVLVIFIVLEIAVIAWNETRTRVESDRVRPVPVAPPTRSDWLVIALAAYVAFALWREANVQGGRIYEEWDAVMSWNVWAEDWYHGRFPQRTFHYPQLLPALLSLPYAMLQDERLQQFSKVVAMAVPLIGFATALRLAMFAGSYRRLMTIAVIVAVWHFQLLLGSRQPFGGVADVPVAYMVLAAAYAYVLALRAREGASRRDLLVIASVVFAGALLTKQAALLALGVPIAYALFRRRSGVPTRAAWAELALSFLIIGIVAGHWYLYKEYQIRTGIDYSEFASVTTLVQLPWHEKLVRSWIHLWDSKLEYLVPGTVLVLAAVATRPGRWLLLLGVAPAFLVWAFLVSYDSRNFAVGVVPLSCTVVLGADVLFRAARRSWEARRRRTVRPMPSLLYTALAAVVITFIARTAIATWTTPRAALLADADSQKRRLGDPELNRFLYNVMPTLRAGTRIGTPYQYLGHLPGLRDRYAFVICYTPRQAADGLRQSRIAYFLMTDHCGSKVNSIFRSAADSQTVRSLGAVHDKELYEILSAERVIGALSASDPR